MPETPETCPSCGAEGAPEERAFGALDPDGRDTGSDDVAFRCRACGALSDPAEWA